MSKVDDELSRRLRAAQRPVGVDELLEGLERRRSHRERVRRVQAAALGFAVLASTIAGFVALRAAFEPDPRPPGLSPSPAVLPGNGEIVFVKDGGDVRLHIYAARPDGTGERQITSGPTHDSHPAVSPDGRTIAFVHALDGDGGDVIATVPTGGGEATWLTSERYGASDLAWSPDGTQIAFIGHTADTADLFVADVDDGGVRRIDLLAAAGYQPNEIHALVPSHPTWSPDGRWIAFAGVVESDAPRSSDLAMVHPDGSGFEWLPADSGPDEFAPAWSPDGTRIAFLRGPEPLGEPEEVEQAGGPNEIWTISPDGAGERLIATAVEARLGFGLTWAPDATALLVSRGDWIYRVDPSPGGDVRNNFVRLFRGFGPSWQPLPMGAEPLPSATPEPSPSPSPSLEPAGHDIGLGFRLCHLHPLGGIDFLGDGTTGKAWTGSPVMSDGRCSSRLDANHLVAVDVTGDGVADAASEPFEFCQFCRPFAAVDFDADGDDELAVLIDGGTVSSFLVYSVSVAGGEPTVAPLLIAPPGHPAAGDEPGEPFTISSGGDEGYAAWVRCERFPTAPVLVNTWRSHPIEGDVMEVHETAFVLRDGQFHVVETTDYEASVSDPIPNVSDAPACGVDWQLWV